MFLLKREASVDSVKTAMAVFLLTTNPRAREASRQAYLEASAMRLRPARPASAPALRSAQAPAVPVTPLQLLRARAPARPTSAWAPPVAAEASHADETSVAEPAASLSKGGEDRSQGDRGDRCTCEASESSLVSTQQPLHSETSQELDLPEEECDDANEAELQGKVEALRRKELHEKWRKLRQQQKELEEEQQEVQKLLQRTPKRTPGRPQSAASGTRRSGISGSAAELRIDGKAISGTTSRVTPKSRPSSSPGALRRSASAPGQRQEVKKSNLRDLHYESMRRQAAQRLELLKQREIQREPWTHGGSRPSRPWSAIPGYTGYRPHMEEDSMVGCNWSRASLQCIRLFGKPGM